MTEILRAMTCTPIAELSPALLALSAKSFTAVVTLIWPYSSSNSSLTILLAEPDFRLRRTHGQVRVQFTGSSARFVFEAGIGSGDKVLLGLEGAEWIQNNPDVQAQTPGKGIEWDLRYSERLILQIQQSETQKITELNIDNPSPKPQAESVNHFPPSQQELAILESTITSIQRPNLVRTETNEWASPAFIKRARVSYGSLFEPQYDIFADDDGTVQGRGRKRTRFSRESGSWRYSSRSPSPTSKEMNEQINRASFSEFQKEDRPSMTDEGCQTFDFEDYPTMDHSRSLSLEMDIQQTNTLGDDMIYQTAVAQVNKSGFGEADVDKMLPPPKPSLDPEVEAQAAANDQQVFLDETIVVPLSSRPEPVLSNAIPLVSSLTSSALEDLNATQIKIEADTKGGRGRFEQYAPSLGEAVIPDNQTMTEDIYGLSPAAHSSLQDVQTSETGKFSVTDHEGKQDLPLGQFHDPAIRYGHRQSEMAAKRQISNSMSPHEPEHFLMETYPEPDIIEAQQDHLQAGPYYDNNRTRSPASIASDNHRKPMSYGGFAMSRSQSAHSEVVDLTEDSDEEGDGQVYGFSAELRTSDWDTRDEREDEKRVFHNDSHEESEAEDDGFGWRSSNEMQAGSRQRYEDLDANESEADSEMVEFSDNMQTLNKQQLNQAHSHETYLAEKSSDEEDEERSYDEGDGSAEESNEDRSEEHYHRAFQPVNDNQSEEQYDEEEDIFYGKENRPDEVDDITATKKPPGEPEVIDLLSSDEEGVEDDTSSRLSRDIVDEHAASNGEPLSEEISDGEIDAGADTDADAELDDDEADGEEGIPEKEYLVNETHILQSKGEIEHSSGPLLASGIDEPIYGSSPESEEVQNEVSNKVLQIAQKSLSIDTKNELRQHYHIETKRRAYLYSTAAYDGLQGMDGTADDAMDTEMLHPTLSYNKSTDEDARMSLTPKSQTFINPELSTQEFQDKESFNAEHYNQISPVSMPTKQLNTGHKIAGEEHRSDEHLDEIFAKEEHSWAEPAIHSTHIQKSVSDQSFDQPEDLREPPGHDKAIVEGDHRGETTDQQLPTPDATQLTALLGPELTFQSETVVEPKTPPRHTISSIDGKSVRKVTSSPSVATDGTSSPDSYDASAQLALSVLDSPSNESRKESPLSNAALRVKLTRPLQTALGAFTPLKLIRFHLEQKLDVIVLATTQPPEPQRAKNGARHYHVRFNVIDASISISGVMGAQIFRPYKLALPIVKPGDGVLLRNFIVKAEARGSFVLRSDEASSWVVFKDNGEEEVRGPPVEYGDGEREYVANLKTWLKGLDDRSKERFNKVNGHKASEGLKGIRNGL